MVEISTINYNKGGSWHLEMMYDKEKIAAVFKDDKRRFQLAQILFAASISFGWFIADGYRRGLFLLSILLLNKAQRKIDVMRYWHGLTNVAGLLLLTLFLWVTLMPVFCSVESLTEKIAGMARPLEIFLYGAGAMIFACDDFFERKLCTLSMYSAVIVSLFAFTRRLFLSFSIVRDDWSFGMHAALAGIIISSLLPWLLCALCQEKNKQKRIAYTAVIIISLAAIFVTYYRTVWMATAAQLLLAVPLSYYCFNANIMNHKKLFAVVALLAVLAVVLSYQNSTEVRDRVDRIAAAGSNFEKFSTDRGEVWQEAVFLISKHKLGGYGWVEYNDFSFIKKHHPHSSYLQAAFHAGVPAAILYGLSFILFFLLALRYIFTKQGPPSIAYVVALMILASAIGGLTEAYFYVSREYCIPFWTMVSLLLSPLYVKISRKSINGK